MRWAAAMDTALYGPTGFFTRPDTQGPTGHFRTSSTASPLFARAWARLAAQVDRLLGHPQTFDLVEIAAGRGELLRALLPALPEDLRRRTRAVAVELAPRPAGLADEIHWTDQAPDSITGLLIAVEWLDNVPLDIAAPAPTPEPGTDRAPVARPPHYVLVDPTGTERLGPPVRAEDQEWLCRWWPVREPDERAEIGLTRDQAWGRAVSRIHRGLAVAVDYGHLRDQRPPAGTLTGYRLGRQVLPTPDGTCDLTAHVCLDSLVEASTHATGRCPVLMTQREALHHLGIRGSRPPVSLAHTDPALYVRRLSEAGAAAELTDRGGLGGHWWLVQPVGVRWPGPAGDALAGAGPTARGQGESL